MSRDYHQKLVPAIKAVDYRRVYYRRAVTTSSRNRHSNSTIKRNIRLQSPKCQLNFKTSTKILANQSQIQTKTQRQTTSHPKHIAQTRNNDNISKNIKRKDAEQGKLHKSPTANRPKKKPYKETANQHSAYNTDEFTYNANTQRWS